MKTILQTIFRFPISILAIFFLTLDVVKFFPTQILDDNFDLVFFFIFFGGIFTQLLTERNAFWKSKKLLVYSIFSLIFLLYLVFYYLYIDWGYPFIGHKIFTFIFAIPLLWKHQPSFFLLKKQVKNDENTLEIRKSFLDFTLHLLSYGAMSVLVFIVIIVCLSGVNALLNYLFSTEYLTFERIVRWIALPFAATFFLYSIPKYTQKVLQVNFLFRLFFSRIFPIFLAFYLLIVFAYFSKIIFLQEKPVLIKENGIYIFMIIFLLWWFLSARLIQYKNVFFHYFHRYFFWAFFIFMLLNYYFYYVEILIWTQEIVFVSIIYIWGILLSIYFLIYGVQKIIHFPFLILILIWISSFHTAFFLFKNKKDFKIFIEKENLTHATTGLIDQSKLLDLKLLDYVEYMRLVRELLNKKQVSFLKKFVFQANFLDLDKKNDLDTSDVNHQLANKDRYKSSAFGRIFNDLEQKLQIQVDSIGKEKIVLHIYNNNIYFIYYTEKRYNRKSDSQNDEFSFYRENSEKDLQSMDQEKNNFTLQADGDQLIFFKNGIEITTLTLSDFRMKDFLISENTKILFRHISFEYLPNKKIKINSLSGEFISPH